MFFSTLKEYLTSDLGKVKPKRIKDVVKEKRKKLFSAEKRKRRAEGTGASGSRRMLVMLWRNKFLILLFTVIFMVALSAGYYIKRGDNIITTMSLNYQEGSKGLNPNSTRFNVYELKSNEVLKRALEYMGVEDRITIDEFAKNITIENTNQKQIKVDDQSSYFISTSFRVIYRRNDNLGRISTDDVVKMLCKAYNDIFHEQYSDNQAALKYDIGDITSMEYVEIGDSMNMCADRMKAYLAARVKANGTFKSEATNETFQTVSRLVQNLQDYQISKYNSYVLETGLARNKSEFIQTLYYNNSVLDMQYQKSMADYAVRQDGITKYDEAMIGTVMIPSINEQDEYYMSRTNIGIDYLAKDAETHLSAAKDTLKQIEINNDIIEKLGERTPTLENFGRAEEMLRDIESEFERISRIALETDKEYIKYNTKDYLTFMRYQPTFFEEIRIKRVLAGGLVFCILICCLFCFIGRRRAKRGGRA